jgi:hypothetical protein
MEWIGASAMSVNVGNPVVDVSAVPSPRSSKLQNWKQIFTIWLQPRVTMRWVASQGHGVWRLPLIIVTLALLLCSIVYGTVQRAHMGEVKLPDGYQYYMPEEQERFQSALAIARGPLFVYIFPAIESVGGFWLQWIFFSTLLYIGLHLTRVPARGMVIRNAVAWSSLPYLLRYLLQVFYVILSGHFIEQSGLAIFAPQAPIELHYLMISILSGIDFYTFWQFFLLLLGIRYATRKPWWRIFPVVFIIMAAVLLISAFISYATAQLGAMLS